MTFGTNCYQCNFIIFICNLVLLSSLLFFLFFSLILCFCNTVKFIVMQIKVLIVVVDPREIPFSGSRYIKGYHLSILRAFSNEKLSKTRSVKWVKFYRKGI